MERCAALDWHGQAPIIREGYLCLAVTIMDNDSLEAECPASMRGWVCLGVSSPRADRMGSCTPYKCMDLLLMHTGFKFSTSAFEGTLCTLKAELGLLNTNCNDGLIGIFNGVMCEQCSKVGLAAFQIAGCLRFIFGLHSCQAYCAIQSLTCPSFRDWKSLLAANVPIPLLSIIAQMCGLQYTPFQTLGSRHFTNICKGLDEIKPSAGID